jgi:cobalamin synthase
LNPDYDHLRLRQSRAQAVGGVIFAAFALLCGGVLLWAATENWWLTVVISIASMSAGLAHALWTGIKRMRRGEKLKRGEGNFSLTQIVFVTGVGTYLSSRTLESVVYAFFGVVGALVAGVVLAAVCIGRPEDPADAGN